MVGLTLSAQCIHIGAMYDPGVNSVLQIEPQPLDAWATVFPIALGLVFTMETYKLFVRWNERRRTGRRPLVGRKRAP